MPRIILFICSLFLLISCSSEKKPNVLFIAIDDLNDWVNVLGGKVLDTLEESEYADNTIVVLWSDHGYHLGEKNRFAKQSLWERDTKEQF